MMWKRVSPLAQYGEKSVEQWTRNSNGNEVSYPVDIYLGKKMNMSKLKKGILESIKQQNAFYSESRTRLYAGKDMEDVNECMITGVPTASCTKVANIYGAEFVQTPDTGHVFVRRRPSAKAIHEFYSNSSSYAATYTDKTSSEERLNSIAVPWCEWMINIYMMQYGKAPEKVLDIGAGGGHFVEACKRRGIKASGIELSKESQAYAKQSFGLDLDGRDFLDCYKDYLGYDVVTFWGLLEHTPNPVEIASLARKVVEASDKGMTIAKLPRWNSLSAAAQRLNPGTIIRHLDPAGHIMLFTDASAAEMFVRSAMKPVAAWYFGMDAYETFMQLGNATKEYASFLGSGDFQMELQQFIDENRFSDNIALAGVPISQ